MYYTQHICLTPGGWTTPIFEKLSSSLTLLSFFSLFMIDYHKNFMILGKTLKGVRFGLLLSSQDTSHTFVDIVGMIQDAYVRKK